MDKMKELYEKVASSSELQAEFSQIMKDNDQENADQIKDQLISFAKKVGYTVTFEEVEAFFENLAEKQQGELGDAELDAVAGGKNFDGGNIQLSFTSIGTYCATLSVKSAIMGQDCSDKFWTN